MPYRRRALSIGVAAFLSAVAAGAYAQDTSSPATPAQSAGTQSSDETVLQGVTVTGLRASLKKSLDRKRDNDTITEQITAEDIGKLPATNTAEALAEMPGVTLDHQFTAQQRVSIDGADPSLNLSFLDGHPVSQAIWLYGDSPNRGFNFALLPSEILGAVEVYKAPEAHLIEGSLGGTILMHTVQPLDVPANTLSGSVGYNYDDLVGDGKPNVAVFYSWRDPHKRFGFDISAQHYEQVTDRQGEEIFGYTPLSQVATSSTYVSQQIASGGLKATDLMPQEINIADFSQTEKRDSVTGNIQFKPLSNLDLGAGLMWMQDHLNNLNTSMYAFMLQPGYIQGITSLTENSGVITSGTTTESCNPTPTAPCTPSASTIFDNNARGALITTQGFDLHGTLRGDSWKLYSQVGISNSHNVLTQAFIETAYGGTYNWAIDQGFDFASPAQAQQASSWQSVGGFMGNYANEPYSARDLFGQVDFTKDFDFFINQVQAGFRYAIHHEGEILNVYTGVKATGSGTNGAATLADVGAGPLTNLSGLNEMNFYPSSVNHVQPGSSQAIYNWVLSTPGLFNNLYYPYFYEDSFGVSQASEAGYVQLNFAQDKLRGNIGVRVVSTTTNSSGYDIGGNTPTAPGAGPYVTVGNTHLDPLPALNVAYNLTPNTILRGALNETIAWAPYNQMAPYTETNDTVLTGTGGNANLNPYRSVNLNVASEWYFAPESLLSLGLFHKQIINYIVNGADIESQFNSLFVTSPSQYQNLVNTPGTGCNATGYCNYSITRPQNGGRATVDGVLVSFQEPFSDTGFGIRSNLTYSDGTTHSGGNLPYNSKESLTIAPYFDNKGPFTANLSYNWRSKYLAGGYVAGAPATITAAYTEIDAAASYQITKNVGIGIDALNLLDSTYTQYLGDPNLPTAHYKNGREFLATLHLKL